MWKMNIHTDWRSKMKKFIYTVVLGVTMMCSLVACGNSESDEKNTEKVGEEVSDTNQEEEVLMDLDVQEIADAIHDKGDFKDNLATVDTNMALTRLYGLDSSIVEAAAFYTNSNATAEEIAVIRVKDSSEVETVKLAYKTRVEEQKEACKDYLPDEMPKLEDAVIYSNGNYVILCVSNDSNKIESVIGEIFK